MEAAATGAAATGAAAMGAAAREQKPVLCNYAIEHLFFTHNYLLSNLGILKSIDRGKAIELSLSILGKMYRLPIFGNYVKALLVSR